MCELTSIGFSSFFEHQVSTGSWDRTRLARVSAEHRNEYGILTEIGTRKAQLRIGRFAQRESESLPKVGDWVILDAENQIVQVLERRTALIRGAAGREALSQVLATNVDVVFVVAGLDSAFNPNRIERYLSLVWSSGASPVLVLNKADLVEDESDLLIEAEGHCPGIQVILASSKTAEGLDEIRKLLLSGITAVFVGPSGVGKSSLINALIGEEKMDTGAVRVGDSKGRHTTVHRQLIVLPGGGLVIDTPGLRELQLAESEGIACVFPEIEELAGKCRFRDCTHVHEPGCAIKHAVEQGLIQRERYEHYLKLHRETRAFEVRQDEHLRRKSEKIWGKLSREGKMIRRMKGSK